MKTIHTKYLGLCFSITLQIYNIVNMFIWKLTSNSDWLESNSDFM